MKSTTLNYKLILWAIAVAYMLSMTSCQALREKRCQNAIKKAQELGCLNLDTTRKVVTKFIKGDSVFINTSIEVPVEKIDSFWRIDTCFTKERIKTIIQNLKVTPMDSQTEQYHFKAWIENGQLYGFCKIKDRVDTTAITNNNVDIIKRAPEKCPFDWTAWLIGLLMGSGFMAAMALYITKRK
jgi:hypothetical protein